MLVVMIGEKFGYLVYMFYLICMVFGDFFFDECFIFEELEV